MNILVVGDGAREHAIIEMLSKDSSVFSLMSRKNPAIANLSKDYFICDILNPREVKSWASGKRIDLAFVSPDAALGAGISDTLMELGISVCSPTKDVADIECNKQFARQLMQDHNIPGIVDFFIIDNEKELRDALRELNYSVAVKPIGLTGGKGVKVSEENILEKDGILDYGKSLLKKDGKVLIEEKLGGQEFTLQAFCDGTNLVFMPPVQDHKRAFENDQGPNTGGMGSYSTGELLPFMKKLDLNKAKLTMKKTIEALKKERAEFKGILYGQFMLTKYGPKIIEYNARFGDPEAMNVLNLLNSSLSEIFTRIFEGTLEKVDFLDKSTLVKYFVPEGYPDRPVKSSKILINEDALRHKKIKVYYASVYEKEREIYTTSSRSVALCSVDENIYVA
ncbi:MAG: phosphoribosylamine--glycine ligase, partial [Candidatus Paceibacterota bacterium]